MWTPSTHGSVSFLLSSEALLPWLLAVVPPKVLCRHSQGERQKEIQAAEGSCLQAEVLSAGKLLIRHVEQGRPGL